MKVLLLAHQCSPYRGGDYAVGWGRLLQAARVAELHVLTGSASFADLERSQTDRLLPPGITLRAVADSSSRRAWLRAAASAARELHGRHHFQILHHATPRNFRQPPPDLRLGIPVIWGPLTGAETVPLRLLPLLPPQAIFPELAHTASVSAALWLRRNVFRAASTASVIFAATSATRRSLRAACGVEVGQLPDSGLLSCPVPDRTRFQERLHRARSEQPQRPLRLLWAGDLVSCAALPVLLRALAALGKSITFDLRVAGEGPMRHRWAAAVSRLGLALADAASPDLPYRRRSVRFLGALTPSQLRAQLGSAELFCHTSLRPVGGPQSLVGSPERSGESPDGAATLLAALAAGTPILTFDLHYACDIVNSACGTRIPVASPRLTLGRWSDALRTYADHPDLLLAQSLHCTERARRFLWQSNGDRLNSTYLKLAGESLPQQRAAEVINR